MEYFKQPRLKSVNKVKPEYPLGMFPSAFVEKFCGNITYVHLTNQYPVITGDDWERIFADSINADWKPSNIGLDDIIMNQSAWGAKTVLSSSKTIFSTKSVRLISGRNSPIYSYDEDNITKSADPFRLGEEVLGIWNERVSAIRQKYKFVRTCVLIRNKELTEFVLFEKDTVRYDSSEYDWVWNKRGNLNGLIKNTEIIKFTWQPHGSQFTIHENVPMNALKIRLNKVPTLIDKEKALDDLAFDNSWYNIVQ
ncbi:hypothetical protein RV11_GL002275 [Enterococcus phoeniculicola]|uniref:Uncharacterized protein n=1 Tax=Enterococcus phoeniculicola ATCC BAA-412 TaxID=1158610 RepID=R3WRU0_9ENTE|nr:hypothetical protein [Enterococcus phoeniculicola]EOL50137.1 hypothetical protein UC3_00029 [Enterococcus phoeniculicola ATCC BAA-412]EOT70696.1 hypothetical protein I589_03556 [Enterococcus phoeniculicola ATCC BAA-412]OJG69682.1 hypothetical protein RV11_GL002275 [Enterococcus phoeniculicola]